MPFTLQTHKVRKDKRSGQSINTATNPYVRLAGPDGIYFVQNGQVWSEGGQLIDPVPDWVLALIEKLSPAVKREVKWGRSNFEQSQVDKRASKEARAAPLEQDLEVDRSRAGVPVPEIKPDSTDRPAPLEEDLDDDDFENEAELEPEAEAIDVPEDWRNHPAADRRAWASEISGHDVTSVAEGDPIIEEYMKESKDGRNRP